MQNLAQLVDNQLSNPNLCKIRHKSANYSYFMLIKPNDVKIFNLCKSRWNMLIYMKLCENQLISAKGCKNMNIYTKFCMILQKNQLINGNLCKIKQELPNFGKFMLIKENYVKIC